MVTAKRTTAQKTAAKKTAAKKTTAQKTAARKAPAQKTAAKKTTAQKTAARKAPAQKTAATKATGTSSGTTKAGAASKSSAKTTPPRRTASTSTPAVSRGTSRPGAPQPATPRQSTFAAGAGRAASEQRTPSPLLRAETEREPERRLHVVPEFPASDRSSIPRPSMPRRPLSVPSVRAGGGPLEGAVAALASALRVGAGAAGLSADQAEEQVARTLAYLRRRATGDFEVDEFGFDADFTDNVWLPLLRPLYEKWFRVEVRGIENIPTTGGALIVANHSGTIPVDGLMTQVAIHDAHPAHRHLRMLGADLVFELPFVGSNARRTGSTLASADDAERLLHQGELVGVYPEGFKGVGKPFSERYKLQRFGRGGFVSAALRTGVPIIPCSIIGAEEIYPLIGNISVLARLMGAPYFPVTPFFPLLGPLGLIPLPSKWIIAFGEPVDTSAIGPSGAEDPMLVFDLTDQVRETIQQRLYSLLMQRRSVFF
jgi:1-acyl-sn-glycerol-3-phosphate acyltransferase